MRADIPPQDMEAAADHAAPMERAERIVTTLLIGKLLSANGPEHLCRIRNISTTGMLIETHRPLGFGAWVAVELRSGEKLQGTVAWCGTGRAGVQFVTPIEVDRILAEAKQSATVRVRNQPRAPRFDVRCPASISSNGRYIDVVLENVSQSGARIAMARPPKRDTEVILSVPGLPSRRCTTRWSDDAAAGLLFLEVIPYHELDAWLDHVEVN
ncbi:PilZ domain-containing protein [Sphingomonas sp. S2-65]|uniref:PilZ domain-containing protein n=1 Tax=Sphingomonas sp. S2-65 TaxID=2903960 RepID=UPI001F451DDA|nr:PilZ domain-containing protein [Sphingomonas sp. S2-65]UYY59669.1 PilZ domain-containing protein [Sphingomonas sp. S2-65]